MSLRSYSDDVPVGHPQHRVGHDARLVRAHREFWYVCLSVRASTRRVLREWDDEVVKDFHFTLDQINWFGNVVNVVYLPSAFVMPYLYGSLGVRKTVSYFA